MNAPTSHVRCYLAEWYRRGLTEDDLDHVAARIGECANAMSARGAAVQLLIALAVPDDELIFGVFTADSAEVVDRTCNQAGLPAQRLSTAIDARDIHQP
ncbi:MAG TPA: hypothetical protein VN741_18215 [Mycobacterium sp.]|jgi:hypothetical protein|nr:hypothetical protein [Mycobacterium sp.]